jgi:alpha-D-xyloside xylohydrolase
MTAGGQNIKEFQEADLLLPNTSIYNAFSEKAREIYWNQCDTEWFSNGVDAWWCDNAEPFSDADWNGDKRRPENIRYNLVVESSKQSMDWDKLNSYGLYHTKGIYENWRKTTDKKRVVNLTRSTYTGGQQYGIIPWSGDISAKWSTLRNQIVEGLKISLCGMPYWTLDIGGFFTVKDNWQGRGCDSSTNPTPLWFWNGDYEEGVNDYGYRELYTRWIQFGVFLPIFRSHGTDTPREPWNFGQPGEMFYDTIIKYINLRYELLPYIYSLAAEVHRNHSTIMRSLMFDFIEDKKVWDIKDTYMFGKSFLVSPVTEPMYYDKNNTKLENIQKVKEVYLPKGSGWYNYWTNEYFEGGNSILVDTPINIIPLFVKSGGMIPISDKQSYADEGKGFIKEILIYQGEDGETTLYNDEGDNYTFENGNYSLIELKYVEKNKTLIFKKAEGMMKHQENFKIRFIDKNRNVKMKEITYTGNYMELDLK